ncbi:TPA: hypothetical protein QCJ48_004549 [Enterobacter mori]|uniref:hypothetical protein n=1 Tax=Enterobacter cloacae TaxID=550 RepID=UPI002FD65BA8|nr:hypothetical protein [Enterobacter mori]
MKVNKLFEKKSPSLNDAPKKDNDYILEIRRLNMLENAVINYSGGIDELISRIDAELKQRADTTTSADNHKSINLLLRDLYFYLRDISTHLIK